MKIRDIADEIITGVLTRRVVWEEGNGDPSLLKSEKILVPKAINDGLIDHSLLQEVKLYKEVKDKFYTKKGDVIMKLSTPYDSCVIEKEEDEGLIVPSFSLIIRKINPKYNPYFVIFPPFYIHVLHGLTLLHVLRHSSYQAFLLNNP